MKKSLLFITPELPYPLQSGGKVKTFRLLASLAERYEITLVCPLKLEDSKHLEAFHAVSPCSKHLHEAVNVPRSAKNLLLSYLRRWPLNVQRSFSAALQQRVAEIVESYDLAVLDHYEIYPYIPANTSVPVVYHAHNAYYRLWQRYAELPGNPILRLAAAMESYRVRRCETRVARCAQLTFAAPNDAAELIAGGVDERLIRDTYHLGDDSQLALPELRWGSTGKRLMYVGFLGWEANAEGLLWFIASVWPLLARRHPDLTFEIVGKGADERLLAAVKDVPRIKLLGFVENLEDVYSRSRVSVAPLRFGSGMKVKVLDAMARGMPTVTTAVGAEGIAITRGEQLAVADSPEDFAAAVDLLLTDQSSWEQMSVAARRLISDRYTWDSLFAAMHCALGSLFERPRHSEQLVAYRGLHAR
ncbi:glycosyltransferase [Halioglobus maricola]|uniref:Glycosyltransferase n=1 Tax=Halioglobus maricola TaxID=2601894 RepID=A0A5P9NMX5_9GAMM|nr:glycosyltransferase [Halioglobus maricola]QFU77171.1 glycosyltransferase [Halioglobus maricola]